MHAHHNLQRKKKVCRLRFEQYVNGTPYAMWLLCEMAYEPLNFD